MSRTTETILRWIIFTFGYQFVVCVSVIGGTASHDPTTGARAILRKGVGLMAVPDMIWHISIISITMVLMAVLFGAILVCNILARQSKNILYESTPIALDNWTALMVLGMLLLLPVLWIVCATVFRAVLDDLLGLVAL